MTCVCSRLSFFSTSLLFRDFPNRRDDSRLKHCFSFIFLLHCVHDLKQEAAPEARLSVELPCILCTQKTYLRPGECFGFSYRQSPHASCRKGMTPPPLRTLVPFVKIDGLLGESSTMNLIDPGSRLTTLPWGRDVRARSWVLCPRKFWFDELMRFTTYAIYPHWFCTQRCYFFNDQSHHTTTSGLQFQQ